MGSAGVACSRPTPIGDVRDASPRLVAELTNADVIAAEDTRRLRRLRNAWESRPAPGYVLLRGNEIRRTDELVRLRGEGARVVVVRTQECRPCMIRANRIVHSRRRRRFRVTAVAWSSAVLTALAISGLS